VQSLEELPSSKCTIAMIIQADAFVGVQWHVHMDEVYRSQGFLNFIYTNCRYNDSHCCSNISLINVINGDLAS
jgi:hypothetical protein